MLLSALFYLRVPRRLDRMTSAFRCRSRGKKLLSIFVVLRCFLLCIVTVETQPRRARYLVIQHSVRFFCRLFCPTFPIDSCSFWSSTKHEFYQRFTLCVICATSYIQTGSQVPASHFPAERVLSAHPAGTLLLCCDRRAYYYIQVVHTVVLLFCWWDMRTSWALVCITVFLIIFIGVWCYGYTFRARVHA